jgi:anti-anti-sigma regulatory factor
MSSITLPADCTLRSARAIQEHLAAALHSGDSVTLDCSAVAQADTAGIQLLVCATRAAKALDRNLTLTGVTDALAAVLARAGFALAPSRAHIVINEG